MAKEKFSDEWPTKKKILEILVGFMVLVSFGMVVMFCFQESPILPLKDPYSFIVRGPFAAIFLGMLTGFCK